MRASKLLRPDQETITRFINVLGNASIMLSNSKRARPSFFIFAHEFIAEYIEGNFFKKIDLLIRGLEDGGLASRARQPDERAERIPALTGPAPVSKQAVAMTRPSLSDNRSDAARLTHALERTRGLDVPRGSAGALAAG